MTSKWHRAGDALAVVFIIIFGLGWLAQWRGWLDPPPFRNVEIQEVRRDGNTITLRANFLVTDAPCELELPFVVFGYVLGVRDTLNYEPVRGPSQTGQRHPGQQKMHLIIDSAGRIVDRVEVRTRHVCTNPDGSKYLDDNLMLSVDIPPGHEGE